MLRHTVVRRMLDILKHPLRMDYHVGIALILIILPGFIQTRDSSELDESQEEVTLDDLQTEKHSPSCTYRGRHYNPGDMFTPHPCTSCLCPESGGPVSCSYVQCQPQANCIAYDPDKNKCCPKCLEKGCVYKNRTFSAGARIPTDACTVCYCPWEGGQARCASHRCKPVECVNPLITDGNCCPTCPNGKPRRNQRQLYLLLKNQPR